MKFEEMYDAIINAEELTVTLAGRPGIGKTKSAIDIASRYILNTGKKALYIVGDEFEYYSGNEHYSRINDFPEETRNDLILWIEPYKYRSEIFLTNKIKSFCAENEDIGLIIIDDDRLFDISASFVSNVGTTKIKTVYLAHVSRNAESPLRQSHQPELQDINQTLVQMSSAVFAVLRKNYYDPNVENEYEFVRLK